MLEIKDLIDFWKEDIPVFLLEMLSWLAISALGIKPKKDGTSWMFLYGDNIQEGICGFGDSIREAALDFYEGLCKTPNEYWEE